MSESYCGSPLYMSPQVLQSLEGTQYNYKADIWSLGTLFYELLVGCTPFNAKDKEELVDNFFKGTYQIPKEIGLSANCLDFLNGCIVYEEKYRFTYK